MNIVLGGKLVVGPCDCLKLQVPSGNGVVVFGIDINGLGVIKIGLVGPIGGIPIVKYV